MEERGAAGLPAANQAGRFADRRRLSRRQRQVGIFAVAGLWALDHNLDRLAEDHANARSIAERLAESPAYVIDPARRDQILVGRSPSWAADVLAIVDRARERGVLIFALGPRPSGLSPTSTSPQSSVRRRPTSSSTLPLRTRIRFGLEAFDRPRATPTSAPSQVPGRTAAACSALTGIRQRSLGESRHLESSGTSVPRQRSERCSAISSKRHNKAITRHSRSSRWWPVPGS